MNQSPMFAKNTSVSSDVLYRRLAREIHVAPPAWAWQVTRSLRRPWFAHPGAALRATLLAESPAPFRERNLFVSANALARA